MGTQTNWKEARKKLNQMSDEAIRAIADRIPKEAWEWTDYDTWFHFSWLSARRDILPWMSVSYGMDDPYKGSPDNTSATYINHQTPMAKFNSGMSSQNPATWYGQLPPTANTIDDNFGYRMAA